MKPDGKATARARLIRARAMVWNVLRDVGGETGLRERLRTLIGDMDDILQHAVYLPDLPAVVRKERP